MPLHCGGFYQFEKGDWLRGRLAALPRELRDLLASGKLVLLLDGSGEGLSPYRKPLENLAATLADFEVRRRPVYLTSAIDGAELYRRGCYRHSMTPRLDVIYFPIQFFQIIAGFVQDLAATPPAAGLAPRAHETSASEKVFLSFNYMPRWWRYALMVHLYENNLLGRGHVSFFGKHIADNWKGDTELDDIRVGEILRQHGIGIDPERSVRAVNAMSPLTLDVGPEAERFNIAYKTEAVDLYRETFFSVVTESDFSAATGLRFSEKSVKPLVLGHPVLIIGTSGVVNVLERMGYRLTGGLFRHDYDEVSSDAVRLRMVFRELERVLRMDRYQFLEAFKAERELIDHNVRFSREAVARHRAHEHFLRAIEESLNSGRTIAGAIRTVSS